MTMGGDSREMVLRAYGEVMLLVQSWEMALAMVWWIAERKDLAPSGDFNTQRSQNEIRRFEAAFLRTPPHRIVGAVTPYLEPDTAAGLKSLLSERNGLAHSFLREQSVDGSAFKPGTHAQLIQLGSRFLAATESTMRTLSGFGGYTGPVLDHWPDLAERLIDQVSAGERISRDPSQQ